MGFVCALQLATCHLNNTSLSSGQQRLICSIIIQTRRLCLNYYILKGSGHVSATLDMMFPCSSFVVMTLPWRSCDVPTMFPCNSGVIPMAISWCHITIHQKCYCNGTGRAIMLGMLAMSPYWACQGSLLRIMGSYLPISLYYII